MQIRQLLKIILAVVVVVILVGYTYYQAQAIITGPKIDIIYPRDGSSFKNPLVEILGNTKNISSIMLNGRTIFVNENGVFKEKLLILDGLNTIEIRATDKFGRTIIKTLKLVLTKINY